MYYEVAHPSFVCCRLFSHCNLKRLLCTSHPFQTLSTRLESATKSTAPSLFKFVDLTVSPFDT